MVVAEMVVISLTILFGSALLAIEKYWVGGIMLFVIFFYAFALVLTRYQISSAHNQDESKNRLENSTAKKLAALAVFSIIIFSLVFVLIRVFFYNDDFRLIGNFGIASFPAIFLLMLMPMEIRISTDGNRNLKKLILWKKAAAIFLLLFPLNCSIACFIILEYHKLLESFFWYQFLLYYGIATAVLLYDLARIRTLYSSLNEPI